MAIKRKYQKTVVLAEQFIKDTGNEYKVVAQRPYKDRNNKLPDGILMTLQVTKDNSEYTNENEENMVFENFDVTVLCGKHDVGVKKGDLVSLHDFKEDVSYYIDFSFILRFGDVKKIERNNHQGKMPPLER